MYFVFDDLYFVHLVVVGFVIRLLGWIYYSFSSDFNFDFLSTSPEIGWEESVSDMSCLVLSAMWNLNSSSHISYTCVVTAISHSNRKG